MQADVLDVLVIGAGIVGSACAVTLQKQGHQVCLIDAASPGCGVTAAGMGHLVALDESEQELDLCLYSLKLWREFIEQNPGVGDYSACGTLWVAENEHQLAEAHHRAERLSKRGWNAAAVNPEQLRKLEPALRSGLAGGVRVANDSVVYPPAVAHFLAQELVQRGGQLRTGTKVHEVHSGYVVLANGEKLYADKIIVAAGVTTSQLLPELHVFPRKGHLAITDRYPGRLSHQVVSMDYGQAAMSEDALVVAANIQARPTGQWLIGSCRQDKQTHTALDPAAVSAVLNSAMRLLPCLAEMRVIRAWAGMRPASPDGNPMIGELTTRKGVWIAAGHEGLGVTTAFATANIIADQMAGRACSIDVQAYLPSRFSRTDQGA